MIKALFPIDINNALRNIPGVTDDEKKSVEEILNKYVSGGVSEWELDRALSDLKFSGKVSYTNLSRISQKLKDTLNKKTP